MAPLSVSLYIFYSIAFLPSLSAHSEPSQNVPWNWYSSLNMSNVLYAQFVYFLMWIYFSGNWFVFQRSIFWSSPFLQLVPMLDWTCGGCPGSAVRPLWRETGEPGHQQTSDVWPLCPAESHQELWMFAVVLQMYLYICWRRLGSNCSPVSPHDTIWWFFCFHCRIKSLHVLKADSTSLKQQMSSFFNAPGMLANKVRVPNSSLTRPSKQPPANRKDQIRNPHLLDGHQTRPLTQTIFDPSSYKSQQDRKTNSNHGVNW